MNCAQACSTIAPGLAAWPAEPVREELSERVRDRQAAVTYLRAADSTDDQALRMRLRRRGADLLVRHLGLKHPRLSC
jgi:hypothetical protein